MTSNIPSIVNELHIKIPSRKHQTKSKIEFQSPLNGALHAPRRRRSRRSSRDDKVEEEQEQVPVEGGKGGGGGARRSRSRSRRDSARRSRSRSRRGGRRNRLRPQSPVCAAPPPPAAAAAAAAEAAEAHEAQATASQKTSFLSRVVILGANSSISNLGGGGSAGYSGAATGQENDPMPFESPLSNSVSSTEAFSFSGRPQDALGGTPVGPVAFVGRKTVVTDWAGANQQLDLLRQQSSKKASVENTVLSPSSFFKSPVHVENKKPAMEPVSQLHSFAIETGAHLVPEDSEEYQKVTVFFEGKEAPRMQKGEYVGIFADGDAMHDSMDKTSLAGNGYIAWADMPPIENLDCTKEEQLGFRSEISTSIRRLLSDHTRRPHTSMALTAPSVIEGHQNMAMVGTSTLDSRESFLMAIDVNELRQVSQVGSDPVVAATPIPELISCIKWVQPNRAIVATHDGALTVFGLDMDEHSKSLKPVLRMPAAHQGVIREIATLVSNPHMVVSASEDNSVKLFDISDPSCLQGHFAMNDTVTSVSWPNGSAVFSVTTNDGRLFFFDVREAIDPAKPTMFYASENGDLWSHLYYRAEHCMLGFGDGQIHHLDFRYSSSYAWGAAPVTQIVQDPYCTGIGSMALSPDSAFFCASGLTDFTAYQVDAKTGNGIVHCHSLSGATLIREPGNFACHTAFVSPGELLYTDTAGMIGIYTL